MKRFLVVFVLVALASAGFPLVPTAGASVSQGARTSNAVHRSAAPQSPPLALPAVGAELPSMRREHSRTIRTATGFRTESSVAPMNYQDGGGSWQPIDTTLVAGADGSVHNKAAAIGIDLPADLAHPVTVSSGSSSLAFSWPVATTTAARSVDKNVARYTIDANVSVEYESLPDQLKESISLAGPDAPRQFVFGVQASGVTVRPSASGGADAVGQDGKTVLSIPAATMVDASGASSPVVMQASPNSLTLDASGSWLDAPERVWPVVIDPTTGIFGVADCGIVSNVSTAHCSNTTLAVGSSSSGSVKSRAVMDFADLQYQVSRVAVIERATLTLTNSSVGNGTSTAVDVHPLTEGFDPATTTWIKSDAWTNWTTAGGTYDSGQTASVANAAVSGSLNWDVTDMVDKWQHFDTTEYGFILRATTEAGANTVSFSSADGTNSPTLVVDWHEQTGRPSWMAQGYTYKISDQADLAINEAGFLNIHVRDADIASTGLNTSLDRWYNSSSHYEYTTVGLGWMTSGAVGPRLLDYGGGRQVLKTPDRGIYVFKDAGSGTFTSPPGIDADLVRTSSSPLAYTLKFHQTGETWTINADGDISSIQDRNGNHTDVTYGTGSMRDGSLPLDHLTDSRGRTHAFSLTTTPIAGYINYFEIESTAPRRVQYHYTGDLLTSVDDAAGHTTSFGYDTEANLTSVIDPRGNETDISYQDPYSGEVDTVTHLTADHTNPAWSVVAGQDWTNTGGTMIASTKIHDANGHDTEYFYDTRMRTTKVTDALSHSQSSAYSTNYNVTTYTDALSSVNTVSYNANNVPSSSTAPASDGSHTGQASYLSYGSSGDARYHPTSSTDAQGKCSAMGYDSHFNVTDMYSNQTGAGSPPTCSTGTGDHTSRTYNANGTVATSTDGNGNVTSYTYSTTTGHVGELTAIDNPAPHGDEAFTYGVSSRVATHTDGKSQVTGYTYDNLDRITRITYNGDSTCSSRTTCTDFAYDNNGNLTSRIDNTGTTAFTYDELNRPITKTLPSNANACSSGGTAMTFAYDPVGNLTTHCDGLGTTTYRYNAVNLVSDMAEPGGSCSTTPATKCTTFGYDNANRRTTTVFPTSPVTTQTATYDGAGHLTELKGTTATPTTLTDTHYTYVAPGSTTVDRALRYSMTDTSGTTTNYTYDGRDRLTGADLPGTTNDQTYSWDAANDRTSKTIGTTTTNYTYNAALELTSGATTPAYDANGNETTGPNGRTSTYTVKDQTASTTPSGGSALNFTYADVDSTQRTAAGSTTFADTILGADRSALSGTSTYYIRDPLGNLIGENIGGTRYYYLVDGLGSILKVIDTTAAVKNTYSYDPWGVETKTETVTNPWQYTGGYQDSTGLTKLGTRYYDPNIGRFTQEDPLSGPNPCGYTDSDPINHTDTTGRSFACDVISLFSFGTLIASVFSAGSTLPTPLSLGLAVVLGLFSLLADIAEVQSGCITGSPFSFISDFFSGILP